MTHLLKTTLILTLFFILFSNPITAQNNQMEVGVGTSVTSLFSNFRLTYKKQKKENKWLRLNSSLSNVSYEYQNFTDNHRLSFQLGFSIGLEKRKQIGESKVEFLRGPQGIFRFDAVGNGQSKSSIIGGGIGYLLGVQVSLKKRVKIGIETMPNLTLSWLNANDSLLLNFDYNSNALVIFVVYNFEKKKKE